MTSTAPESHSVWFDRWASRSRHVTPGFSRRGVLGLGLGAGLAATLGAGARADQLSMSQLADRRKLWATTKPARPAKNVIFMASDGMSFGTLTLADLVLRQTRQQESAWLSMLRRSDVRRGLQATWCSDSLVTDSAAAATSWGAGEKTLMGAVNVRPDGSQLLPVLIQAQQAGKATGCVTTTRITHATPAGFFANAPRRDMEDIIAADLVDRKIDVAMGGGLRHFPEMLMSSAGDLQRPRTRADLLAASPSGRLLGLWNKSHVPYVLDRDDTCPSLMDMTASALTRLSARPEGFVLQIEAGRVDHAAHDNDAPSLVAEQIEFDDCIRQVLKWIEGRDDTLVIITTDHGNANPGLTNYRSEASDGLKKLASARKSFEWIEDQMGDSNLEDERRAKLPGLVTQAMGVELAPDELDMVLGASAGKRVTPFKQMSKWKNVLGAVLADHFGVSFISPHHTADLCEVTAIGPGSELLPGVVDNTELYSLMIAAMQMPAGKLLKGMDERMDMGRRPKDD
jgi:alkaline phosphatase